MKILVLGHGGHGKDTFAEYLSDASGLSRVNTSWFVGKRAVWPHMKDKYADFFNCYCDRYNHRVFWRDRIREYNDPKDRLVRELLEEHDIYVGLRCHEEYEATRHMFDMVFWIAAGIRYTKLDPSLAITFDCRRMEYIRNDMNLNVLKAKAEYYADKIKRVGFTS